jgi:hypothetical protein
VAVPANVPSIDRKALAEQGGFLLDPQKVVFFFKNASREKLVFDE